MVGPVPPVQQQGLFELQITSNKLLVRAVGSCKQERKSFCMQSLHQNFQYYSNIVNMGRKNKTTTPENQESCQKLNFLHQASHAVLAINPENVEMSRFYASTMKTIAQKLVFKLDPSIKRTTCKHCHALLIPGITARVRVRRKREKHIVVTCLDCRTVRRYLCRPDYVLWSEQGSQSNNEQQSKNGKDAVQKHQNKEQGKS